MAVLSTTFEIRKAASSTGPLGARKYGNQQPDTDGHRERGPRRTGLDIYSLLLKERIIFLGTPIETKSRT